MRRRILSLIAIASFAALAWQGFGSQSVRAQAKGPSFDLTADHVGLSVPDLEKSIHWYEQMLGFHLVRRTNGKSMQIALLQRGSFHVELFHPMDGRAMPDYRHDPSADLRVYGMKHVGFAVKDVRADIAELKSEGVEVALGPIENKTEVFAFIRDNSGIPLELIQRKQGSGSQPVRAQAKGSPFDLTADHVGLSVPDLEKSIHWYEQMLGFHLVRMNGKGMRIALLQRGSFHVELFAPMNGRAMPDYRHDPSADLRVYGMKHVGFAVKDVRADIAELKSEGVEVALGPAEDKTEVFAFIRDNSGIPLELIQRKQ